MNKALYYNAYQRADSYFQNTAYAARSYPDAAELALLAPLKGRAAGGVHQHLPAALLRRQRQRSAKSAESDPAAERSRLGGQNQKLVNAKTGQPFTFELMLLSGSNFQYVLPFRHNLQRLGIEMQIREVDASQYTRRMRERDFDMMSTVYMAMPFPSADLQILWDSQYIDSSYNTAGVKDPAVDSPGQANRRPSGRRKALLPLGRALDRVLTGTTTCCRCGTPTTIATPIGTSSPRRRSARPMRSASITGGTTSTRRRVYRLNGNKESEWRPI